MANTNCEYTSVNQSGESRNTFKIFSRLADRRSGGDEVDRGRGATAEGMVAMGIPADGDAGANEGVEDNNEAVELDTADAVGMDMGGNGGSTCGDESNVVATVAAAVVAVVLVVATVALVERVVSVLMVGAAAMVAVGGLAVRGRLKNEVGEDADTGEGDRTVAAENNAAEEEEVE
jgi:hypothetical protein